MSLLTSTWSPKSKFGDYFYKDIFKEPSEIYNTMKVLVETNLFVGI
uniref:Uncharacterized protein n=1 Tax=Arundo donax TaxID=35708 RepID=A0A0A9HBL0_ARUDO